ncbi:hypothetical protein Tco_1342269 [Tanacetum coccineum]
MFDELTKMASEHNFLEPETNRFNVNDFSVELVQTPSKEDLDDLFGPFFEEYFEKRSPEYPALKNKLLLISNDVADESNYEDYADLDENTLNTSFCPPVTQEAESSSTNHDPSNMHEFNQVHPLMHTWTKAHPLEQVIGDPSKPVMIRSRLNTNAEVCMYALTGTVRKKAQTLKNHVRKFIAYAAHKNFTIFQMDVKTAFLNGPLK